MTFKDKLIPTKMNKLESKANMLFLGYYIYIN